MFRIKFNKCSFDSEFILYLYSQFRTIQFPIVRSFFEISLFILPVFIVHPPYQHRTLFENFRSRFENFRRMYEQPTNKSHSTHKQISKPQHRNFKERLEKFEKWTSLSLW